MRAPLIPALLATAICAPSLAQDYPSKTITITLVLAAGTGLDVVARTWGEQLAQGLGRPVVIDNRPGANGIVAVNAVKNAPADGHALLVGTSAALALNQTTYKQLPYDSAKDFVPIAVYLKSPFNSDRASVAAGALGAGTGKVCEGATRPVKLQL